MCLVGLRVRAASQPAAQLDSLAARTRSFHRQPRASGAQGELAFGTFVGHSARGINAIATTTDRSGVQNPSLELRTTRDNPIC